MKSLVVISFVLLVLYNLKILKYTLNWAHYPCLKHPRQDYDTAISVIIAFRNEIENLPDLLNALAIQAYPVSLYEVILVNDHSDDGSEILVQRFCDAHPNFRMIHQEICKSGKKSAVMHGIQSASFDLLVTTDADCIPKAGWLASIAGEFQEKHPDMMVGLVDITPGNSFFGKFQEIEFLSLIAAGAGAAAGGNPIYCNGANLSFTRSLFQSYADPFKQHIASGDDTLFMHKVKKDRGRAIILLKSLPSVVITRAVTTWHDFLQQRKRWVSKSLYYRDAAAISTALLVFLINTSSLVFLFLFITGRNYWFFSFFFLIKSFTDILFLQRFLRFYEKKISVLYLMVFELIYPFYTVFFAFAGITTKYSWKGRRRKI